MSVSHSPISTTHGKIFRNKKDMIMVDGSSRGTLSSSGRAKHNQGQPSSPE